MATLAEQLQFSSLFLPQMRTIISESIIVSLADDCTDEKFELVCARAPICLNAMEARITLQAEPSTDQTSDWINQHIEEGGEVRRFVCKAAPC